MSYGPKKHIDHNIIGEDFSNIDQQQSQQLTEKPKTEALDKTIMEFQIAFEWVITHKDIIIIEADTKESAITKLNDLLRNRKAPDYEDPSLWLPEDKEPVLRVKTINEFKNSLTLVIEGGDIKKM